MHQAVSSRYIFGDVLLSLQSHPDFERDNDGDRRLLGKRQSLLVAGAARTRIQAAAVYEPRPAVFQAGAQIAADARAQLARQSSSAQRRRLRVFRVAGGAVLPGFEVPRA